MDWSAAAAFGSLLVATLALVLPPIAMWRRQLEAQLTFRNIIWFAQRLAIYCAREVAAGRTIDANHRFQLDECLRLTGELEWRSLRPGPLTEQFAHVVVHCGATRALLRGWRPDKTALGINAAVLGAAMQRVDDHLAGKPGVHCPRNDVAHFRGLHVAVFGGFPFKR